MTVARTRCVALVGVSGHVVEVEADVGNGLPGMHLIGLPDTALSEARDRVRSALVNSRYAWPDSRITISLFPASLPKRGSQFDLAIAVALLGASGLVPAGRIAEPFFLGELGLDGRVRAVRGVLPAVLTAVEAGATRVVVPLSNAAEAALVPGVTVLPVGHLSRLVEWLRSDDPAPHPDVRLGPASGGMGPRALLPALGGPQTMPPGAAVPPDGTGGPGQDAAPNQGRDGAESWPGAGPWEEPPQEVVEPAAVPPHHAALVAEPGAGPDLRDVAGQPMARRALEICAAGGHNLWMVGAPGTGKTMLAERLPTLLPSLESDHALEVTAIHSIAGVLPPDRPLLTRPPFVSPHHTATVASIIGGGSGLVRPGAVSLAHRGVLFLDEAPEFPASVLDSLRQPLESGAVTVARASGTVTFPARFMLVLAANPCPCGHSAGPPGACRCTPVIRRRYLARLSGPLLDRVDMKVKVLRSTRRELLADRAFAESSAVVAERVRAARLRSAARLAGTPWRTNAEVPAGALHGRFRPPDAAMRPLTVALDSGVLSARGLDRVTRVAWTLADLAGRDRPGADETSAALAMWLGAEH
jgi:magnesium chelatase family protein